MAENSLNSPLQHATRRGDSIVCELCKKTRCSTIYKRHLLMHHNNGEISRDEVQRILFKGRITRYDRKSLNQPCRQHGYMCLFRDSLNVKCWRIVLNLARHLISVHKMNQQSSTFEDMITEGLKAKPYLRSICVNRIHNIRHQLVTTLFH